MQVNADMEFQRRAWTAQRVGWLVIVAVVVAALLGVFGDGPLSRTTSPGKGLRLEYERFIRLQQPTRLRLTLLESPPEVALSRHYLESFRIEQITPEPRAVDASEEWLLYRFGGSGAITVTVDLIPEEFGKVGGAVRVGGETLILRQFVYP